MPVAGINFVTFTTQICIHKILTKVGGGYWLPPTAPLAMPQILIDL